MQRILKIKILLLGFHVNENWHIAIGQILRTGCGVEYSIE
jgi:hypothetical protein